MSLLGYLLWLFVNNNFSSLSANSPYIFMK